MSKGMPKDYITYSYVVCKATACTRRSKYCRERRRFKRCKESDNRVERGRVDKLARIMQGSSATGSRIISAIAARMYIVYLRDGAVAIQCLCRARSYIPNHVPVGRGHAEAEG